MDRSSHFEGGGDGRSPEGVCSPAHLRIEVAMFKGGRPETSRFALPCLYELTHFLLPRAKRTRHTARPFVYPVSYRAM